jgi:sugar-specific transcriptional regulator TrmB
MAKAISLQLHVPSPKSLGIDRDSLVSSQLKLLQPSPIAPTIDNEEIRALLLLGLTPYEAKAYLALIRTGPVSAGKLAFCSHVPRSKLYGTLRGLEQKGLVHVAPSKPETFTAVSPLAVLKAKAEEISDQAAAGLEIVQKLAEEYELKATSGGELGLPREANELWHIDGRKHIYHRVGQMLSRAVKSISYYATPAGLVRAYKAHADCLEKVGKRGVAVRVLAQTSKDVHLVTQELAAVVKIRRTTKPLAANFVCIDGQELVVIENSPGDFDVDRGTDRAAWTRNKLLVGLYENLFERVWENSSPLHY